MERRTTHAADPLEVLSADGSLSHTTTVGEFCADNEGDEDVIETVETLLFGHAEGAPASDVFWLGHDAVPMVGIRLAGWG